jgi:hypothetical protein
MAARSSHQPLIVIFREVVCMRMDVCCHHQKGLLPRCIAVFEQLRLVVVLATSECRSDTTLYRTSMTV